MLTFSLNSFIKISLLDDTARFSEIQRKLENSGGYDFYHTLTRAIKAKASGEPEDAIQDILLSPSKDNERLLNQKAYAIFNKKFKKSKQLTYLGKNKSYKVPDLDVAINITPIFSNAKSDLIQVHSIWATQKPILRQSSAAIACYIMRQAYKNTRLANSQFCFTDLVGSKTYSEKQIIPKKTAYAFKAVAKGIQDIMDEIG